MKNILIRCDSSSQIGFGHIMRDLVLAKQFKNANITFASQELSGNANAKIIQESFNLRILNSNDKDELCRVIKELSIDTLIIDNYAITYKEEKHIKKKTNVTLFVLDDTYEKHYCDILLNHNISAKKKRYINKVPPFCELRCGEKYTLLRNEFHKEKNKCKKKKESQTKTVFVAIGATDHTNINIKILKVLNDFETLKVRLITTSANKNLTELQNYVKNNKQIKLYVDTKKVAKLMRKSDFGIITPSVSANEAHFMKLPFIAIKTAKNQDDMYRYLKQKNYLTLQNFDALLLSSKIKKILKNLA
jgi:UDP-2,4-diacetamido-2,4,6-trideoxy-beta-L-altropyranose hydrolase